MFAHKEISHKVADPPVPKTLDIFWCGSTTNAVRKFVCILSVLCTVSVLILHGKDFSSSALISCHVLISQNVAHVLESKRRAWVLRTWLQFAAERKRKEAKPEFQLWRFLWKAHVNIPLELHAPGLWRVFRGGAWLLRFFVKCGAFMRASPIQFFPQMRCIIRGGAYYAIFHNREWLFPLFLNT